MYSHETMPGLLPVCGTVQMRQNSLQLTRLYSAAGFLHGLCESGYNLYPGAKAKDRTNIAVWAPYESNNG